MQRGELWGSKWEMENWVSREKWRKRRERDRELMASGFRRTDGSVRCKKWLLDFEDAEVNTIHTLLCSLLTERYPLNTIHISIQF